MSIRFAFAAVTSMLLIGCAPQIQMPSDEEVWTVIEGCDGDEVCSKAQLLTRALNKQGPKNFGQGVTLRNAETDGKTVSLGIEVPSFVAVADKAKGRTPKEQLADIFEKEFCKESNTKRFIDIGGAIEAVVYLSTGPSDEVFSRHTVDKC